MSTSSHIKSTGLVRIAAALAALALAVSPFAVTSAHGGTQVNAMADCCGP
jgi:hypothetical protein